MLNTLYAENLIQLYELREKTRQYIDAEVNKVMYEAFSSNYSPAVR